MTLWELLNAMKNGTLTLRELLDVILDSPFVPTLLLTMLYLGIFCVVVYYGLIALVSLSNFLLDSKIRREDKERSNRTKIPKVS